MNWYSMGRVDWPESVEASVPVRIDGQGTVVLAKGVKLGYRPASRLGKGTIHVQARTINSNISIGQGTHINNNSSFIITDSLSIGKGCLIGDRVTIFDSDFHELAPLLRHTSAGVSKPVKIGDNVWIGSSSMILKGVSIGDNTVVGAMSLVSKSLPPNCVAAGNPAKIIRFFDDN